MSHATDHFCHDNSLGSCSVEFELSVILFRVFWEGGMDGKSKRALADVWFSRGMCVYIYRTHESYPVNSGSLNTADLCGQV